MFPFPQGIASANRLTAEVLGSFLEDLWWDAGKRNVFTERCNFSWQIILVPSKTKCCNWFGVVPWFGVLFLKVWVKEGDLSHVCRLDLEGKVLAPLPIGGKKEASGAGSSYSCT